MNYSDEQLKIINWLKLDKNIAINAVAGSGKTTTSFLIAKEFSNKSILLLTYNNKLKEDSESKRKKEGIKNLKIQTFHAFFGSVYNQICKNDIEINEIIKSNKECKTINYDIVIFDEAQDINLNIYELLVKTFSRVEKKIQVCVFGDSKQSIYEFMKSSSVFLSKSNSLFNFNKKDWIFLKLSNSFRLTKNMCDFINDVYMDYKYIKSKKELNNSVEYIVLRNPFDAQKMYDSTKDIFKNYKPEDIFIIAPSVKSVINPVAVYEKYLSDNIGLPIYKPLSDDEELNDSVMDNKIVFTSIHQVKGRERKVAIVFSCNRDYNVFYDKKGDKNKLSNSMYVALTRASEKLVTFHGVKKNENNDFSGLAFPFTNLKELEKYYSNKSNFDFLLYSNLSKKFLKNNKNIDTIDDNKSYSWPVTNLISFIDMVFITDLYKKVEIVKSKIEVNFNFNEVENFLVFKNKDKKITESLSVYNGIFFPLKYQIDKKYLNYANYISFIIESAKNSKNNPEEKYFFLSDQIKFLESIKNERNDESLIKLSILLASESTSQVSRINQINEYNWISESSIEATTRSFDSILSSNLIFEKQVKKTGTINKTSYNYEVNGFVDCIDNDTNTVWEFKFCRNIGIKEQLQLIAYKHLLINEDKKYLNYSYKLFNLKTSKIYELILDSELTNKIFNMLVELKFESSMIDGDFNSKIFEKALKIFDKYNN